MERYWDCCLCRIEDKGNAFRCRTCYGKLRGRDRLLREVTDSRKTRKVAGVLSSLAAGLGQVYARRWVTGVAFGILVPLSVGLVVVAWRGVGYGHLFLAGAALFVLAAATMDARFGPRVRAAPCQKSCPAHLDIPDYLQLIVDGDYEQGFSLIRTRIPLVGVIGRICPHPCETSCIRGIDGEPISINGCKRFLADRRGHPAGEWTRGLTVPQAGKMSVGVVGSGPAGIACAYYLSVFGASVTVYEADEVVGGRLATSIPDFRLPPGILGEEIEDLRSRGVVFATRSSVGSGGIPVEDLLRKHGALFLGAGAQRSLALEMEGAELFQDFQTVLRRAKLGLPADLGKKVAVLGGGDAAMDVCRTALRCGTEEVHLLYRRTREEMPCRDDEVEECLREGASFHTLVRPVRVQSEGGRLRGLVVQKMRLGEPDHAGRPKPEPVSGSEWTLDVDTVIPAFGSAVGGGILDDVYLRALRREPDGRVWVEPEKQRTSLPRIYAGGDMVTGPGTAVLALSQGRQAALTIWGDLVPESWKRGPRLTDRRIRKPFSGRRETPEEKIREVMPRLPERGRLGAFREVEVGLPTEAAHREAARCLQCHREL